MRCVTIIARFNLNKNRHLIITNNLINEFSRDKRLRITLSNESFVNFYL